MAAQVAALASGGKGLFKPGVARIAGAVAQGPLILPARRSVCRWQLFPVCALLMQAAYRWWASLDLPAPPPEAVPPLAVQLVQRAVSFVTHSYTVRFS